jgi:hypothetical protein
VFLVHGPTPFNAVPEPTLSAEAPSTAVPVANLNMVRSTQNQWNARRSLGHSLQRGGSVVPPSVARNVVSPQRQRPERGPVPQPAKTADTGRMTRASAKREVPDRNHVPRRSARTIARRPSLARGSRGQSLQSGASVVPPSVARNVVSPLFPTNMGRGPVPQPAKAASKGRLTTASAWQVAD